MYTPQCKKYKFDALSSLRTKRTFARSPDGPVHVNNWVWDGEYTCYDTGEPLSRVKEHLRLGIPVRAHWRSLSSGIWSNMSIEHKAAQHKICKALEVGTPYTYEVNYDAPCVTIPGDTTQLERRISHGDTHFDLDVGFTCGGDVVGAVEIYWKHEVDENKAWELSTRFPWVEVRAEVVLAAKYGACLPTCNSGRQMLNAANAAALFAVERAKAGAATAATAATAAERANTAAFFAVKRAKAGAVTAAEHAATAAERAAIAAERLAVSALEFSRTPLALAEVEAIVMARAAARASKVSAGMDELRSCQYCDSFLYLAWPWIQVCVQCDTKRLKRKRNREGFYRLFKMGWNVTGD